MAQRLTLVTDPQKGEGCRRGCDGQRGIASSGGACKSVQGQVGRLHAGTDQEVLANLPPCVALLKCSSNVALVAVQTTNAVDFVKLLLDMREKYESTITQAFADDKNFKNTLNSVRNSWRCVEVQLGCRIAAGQVYSCRGTVVTPSRASLVHKGPSQSQSVGQQLKTVQVAGRQDCASQQTHLGTPLDQRQAASAHHLHDMR